MVGLIWFTNRAADDDEEDEVAIETEAADEAEATA
jgi:hypothetical protein